MCKFHAFLLTKILCLVSLWMLYYKQIYSPLFLIENEIRNNKKLFKFTYYKCTLIPFKHVT